LSENKKKDKIDVSDYVRKGLQESKHAEKKKEKKD